MNLKAKTEEDTPPTWVGSGGQGKTISDHASTLHRTMETTKRLRERGDDAGTEKTCGDRRGCRAGEDAGEALLQESSAGAVEGVSMASWSTASRSTPRTRGKGCSELRPRSMCLDQTSSQCFLGPCSCHDPPLLFH